MNNLAAAFSILSQSHPVLRLQKAAVKPVAVDNAQAAAYLIDEKIFVNFNASAEEVSVSLPEGIWNLNISENIAGNDFLALVENCIRFAPISAAVLTRFYKI